MRIEIEYPEHIAQIKEIQAVLQVGDFVGTEAENDCDELEDNLNVATAQESGIKRREKILGIQPLDTESLEDRRLRVALKWFEKAPYTLKVLKRRLDACLGEKNYVLDIDYNIRKLECLIELTRKSMVKSVNELIEDILPLDVEYKVDLRYNQYTKFKQFTYEQLQQFSHEIMRNEVI